MVIDINNSSRNSTINGTGNSANLAGKSATNSAQESIQTTTPATPTPPPTTASSGVFISTEAQAMQKLAQQLAEPPVNQPKVAHLKQAIANKTYTINPERIAEKLLQADEQAPQSN